MEYFGYRDVFSGPMDMLLRVFHCTDSHCILCILPLRGGSRMTIFVMAENSCLEILFTAVCDCVYVSVVLCPCKDMWCIPMYWIGVVSGRYIHTE